MRPEETQDPVETQMPQNSKPDPSGVGEPYPGFGKRHDIFYEYQPPEADSPPAPPSKPFIPPPPTYSAELSSDETYVEEPRNGHKKLIVVFVVLLTVMAGAIIYLVMFGTKKPATNNSNNTQTAATNPDIVNTSCYNFTLPKPHTQVTTADSCSGTYTSNGNDITVTPIMVPYASLDAVVSAWKTSNPNNTIVSQNPANFGAYSAVQIFWNPPNTPNEEDMTVLTFTLPDPINPKYSNQGTPIYAFEVDGRYDSQSSSKTVYDSILGSWTWK